uniref:Isoform 2 of Probable beta-1,3-galactosyltransferase 2 n=1 Tax=Solanum tuberosum TaxID=4113 RepID=M1C147_SOLTU
MITRTLKKTRCIREFSETSDMIKYKLYQWEREERLPLYLLQILLAKERDNIVATNM